MQEDCVSRCSQLGHSQLGCSQLGCSQLHPLLLLQRVVKYQQYLMKTKRKLIYKQISISETVISKEETTKKHRVNAFSTFSFLCDNWLLCCLKTKTDFFILIQMHLKLHLITMHP